MQNLVQWSPRLLNHSLSLPASDHKVQWFHWQNCQIVLLSLISFTEANTGSFITILITNINPHITYLPVGPLTYTLGGQMIGWWDHQQHIVSCLLYVVQMREPHPFLGLVCLVSPCAWFFWYNFKKFSMFSYSLNLLGKFIGWLHLFYFSSPLFSSSSASFTSFFPLPLLSFPLFFGVASCILSWLQMHYVAEIGFELLIFLEQLYL